MHPGRMGHKFVEGPATNAKGEVFFNDVTNSKTYKIGLDNKVTEFIADSKRGNGQAFGPDGRLYAVVMGDKKVLAYDANGKPAVLAEGWVGNDIAVAHNGNVYVTNPPADNENAPSKVWLIKPSGEKLVVDTGLKYLAGDRRALPTSHETRSGLAATSLLPVLIRCLCIIGSDSSLWRAAEGRLSTKRWKHHLPDPCSQVSLVAPR